MPAQRTQVAWAMGQVLTFLCQALRIVVTQRGERGALVRRPDCGRGRLGELEECCSEASLKFLGANTELSPAVGELL